MAVSSKAAPAHADAHAPPGHAADLLIALLATDWVVGDKHHLATIRAKALALLATLGADGAEAKARLEGHSAP